MMLSLDAEGLDLQLPNNLYFLPFLQETVARPGMTGSWYEGLVLQPTGNATGEFKRIGVLKVRDETSDLFRNPGNKQAAALGWRSNKEYESFDGKLFTISIV
jgi:hypothetical protein